MYAGVAHRSLGQVPALTSGETRQRREWASYFLLWTGLVVGAIIPSVRRVEPHIGRAALRELRLLRFSQTRIGDRCEVHAGSQHDATRAESGGMEHFVLAIRTPDSQVRSWPSSHASSEIPDAGFVRRESDSAPVSDQKIKRAIGVCLTSPAFPGFRRRRTLPLDLMPPSSGCRRRPEEGEVDACGIIRVVSEKFVA